MKKICWLSSDYFTDCDIGLVEHLSDDYQIHWTLVYPHTLSRFRPEDFQELAQKPGLQIRHAHSRHRMRHPRHIQFFYRILRDIVKQKPDLVYINFNGLPYFIFLAALMLRRSNTIFATHQGAVHEGLDHKGLTRLYFRFWYSWFLHFNLFSETQATLFRQNHPKKHTFVIPLSRKNFGESQLKQSQEEIVFFNFGTIRQNKNIACLIEAACQLYEQGQRGFRVVLKGECPNWGEYREKIRYPEIFECDIRQIPNAEIPDLFRTGHYLVLPYRVVSQSGILKIALHYHVPVIASDLEGFRSEITEGYNGYLFQNESAEDLARVLQYAIRQHQSQYNRLREAQKKYTDTHYSGSRILDQYREMFETVNQSNAS